MAISCGIMDNPKYDLGFADASGNFVGLMLEKDKNGNPYYAEFSDPAVAQQYFTGQINYANLEPLKEIQLGTDSHHLGFGQEFQYHPNKYYYGINIDNRFKNMSILGPLATAATIPSVLTIQDAGLEAWDDANTLTHWTYAESHAGNSLTREATKIDEGTYSASFYVGNDVGGYAQVSQEAATFAAAFQGTTFSVAARFRHVTGVGNTKGQLIIDDGVDTTTVDTTITTAEVWETVVCTHKVSDTATKLDVILKAVRVAGAGTLIVDNIKFPEVGVKGSHFAEFDDDLLIADGSYLLRMDSSTGSIAVQAGFPTDINGLTNFVDGRLYIFQDSDDSFLEDVEIDTNEALDISETGIDCDADPSTAVPIGSIIKIESELMYVSNSVASTLTVIRGILGTEAVAHDTNKDIYIRNNFYYYMDLSENVTRSDSVKDFAATIGSTMYSVLLPNMVFTATNPTTDTWSSETHVGSISDNITAILGIAGTPFVLKEDLPYYIDSSGTPQQLAPQMKSLKTSTSGENAIDWKGNLYIQCGAQTLYEYDVSSALLTDISPAEYITNSSDFDGRVQAISGDFKYLYVAIDNATKIEILAGRWETSEGTTQWVWHTLAELTLDGAEKLYCSSVYKNRLWVSSTSSSNSLYYYPTTSMYGNITGDTDYTFQTGGYFITPFLHANLRGDSKGYYKITLTMDDTSATVYWRAYYQLLDGNWTEINSTSKFKTSPTTTAYLPVETTTSNKPASTMIRFKFEAVTGATGDTPKLLNYDVRAWWFPYNKKIISCVVRCADDILRRDGQIDEEQSLSTVKTALDAWINPSTAWARAFYPPYWASATDTVYAKLLPTEPFMQLIKSEKHENQNEYVYNLMIQVESGVTH